MKLLLGNDEILFRFLSYNSIVILYKNTFYNYDELQMSSCAVYFILNTVLVVCFVPWVIDHNIGYKS